MDMERKNQTHATLRQSYLGSAGRPFTSAISASQSNVDGGWKSTNLQGQIFETKNNIPNNFRDSIVLPVWQVVVLPLEVKLSPILLLQQPSAFSIVLLSIAIRDAENFVFFSPDCSLCQDQLVLQKRRAPHQRNRDQVVGFVAPVLKAGQSRMTKTVMKKVWWQKKTKAQRQLWKRFGDK